MISVQFDPPDGTSELHLAEVWQQLRHDYPSITEHAAIPPVIESFPFRRPTGLTVNFSPVGRNRYRLTSADSNRIVDLQYDRLTVGWTNGETGQDYPRFEKVLECFISVFNDLTKALPSPLAVTQAEVQYSNSITLLPNDPWDRPFKGIELSGLRTDLDYGEVAFGESVTDEGGTLRRLHAAVRHNKAGYVDFILVYRGTPGHDSGDVMRFLLEARAAIVKTFRQYTSERYHEYWGLVDDVA